MTRNPRGYPDEMVSAESGRLMKRGEKLISLTVEGEEFHYRQPGWWCSLDDPDDFEGQLTDEDNKVADMAYRSAEAAVRGEQFTPVIIRAIRLQCGLSQREAGRIFGAGEKSFEKYESGEIRPSEPMRRLLRLAMERPDLFTKPPAGKFVMPTEADAALIRNTLRQAQLDRIYEPLLETVPSVRHA